MAEIGVILRSDATAVLRRCNSNLFEQGPSIWTSCILENKLQAKKSNKVPYVETWAEEVRT